MVYCGKPSKGCGACRARKVKCDQAKPSCNRCIKTNRICPGYRDQLSLLFRDESSSVAKKAKSSSSDTTISSSKHELTPSITSLPTPPGSQYFSASPSPLVEYEISRTNSPASDWSYDGRTYGVVNNDDAEKKKKLSLMSSLSVDRRQQAICFCISNFGWLGGSLAQGFNLDADISPTASFAERAMVKGILSVGMANLSRIGSHSQSMKIAAQEEYMDALKNTNAAISHPTQAKEDSTLTAILCLSLFEILTSKRAESIDSFVEHTRGAVALLELRGESQLLAGSQAVHLFQFLRNEIIVSCLMRYYKIPPSLLILSEQATMLPDAPYSFTATHQMSILMFELNDLRIEDKQTRTVANPSLLSRAFALDSEFEALMDGLPPDFIPQVYTLPPDQYFEHPNFRFRLSPFEGRYHVHEGSASFYYCTHLNHLRYGRIFSNELILRRLRQIASQPDFVPTEDFKDLCYRTRDLVRQLALDICASVPYLCGFLTQNAHQAGLPNVSAGGIALLFPLFVAASVDGYGFPTSNWISTCFEMIGREMGIDQSFALVELLPTEKGMVKFIDAL